jgi:hypothetical protein
VIARLASGRFPGEIESLVVAAEFDGKVNLHG